MASLGKGYTSSPDPAGDRSYSPRSLHKKRNITRAGSSDSDFSRSGPAFRQSGIEIGNQATVIQRDLLKEGRPGSRAARQPISGVLRQQVFKRDQYRCVNCQVSLLADKRIKLEVDHVVPVSRGGTNDPHNLQTLCHKCNQEKKASLV